MTRKRIFQIIQPGRKSDKTSRAFDIFIVILVALSCILAILDTFDNFAGIFYWIELVIMCCFIAELALRLWTADFLYSAGRIKSGLKYLISFNGVIEWLTILAFFLPSVVPSGLVIFRALRVIRILRLFKISPRTDAMSVIVAVLRSKRAQLLSSLALLLMLLLSASLIMYSFENAVQPEIFTNALSGIWWAVSAIFTVGYGDIYPVTLGGKMFSIVITFIGVCLVAIPTGILSAGFTEHAKNAKPRAKHCPGCGEKIE